MQLVHPVSFKLSGGLLHKTSQGFKNVFHIHARGLWAEPFMTRISIDPDNDGRNAIPLMYTHVYMANRPGQRKGWCGGGG